MSHRFISGILLGSTMVLIWLGLMACSASAQIREYRRPLMSGFGYADVDRRGNPYVVINPRMCRRLGPELCSFFRNHEYAHHYLNHFGRGISVQQAEAEADRWAARTSSPTAVAQASQFFASGQGGTPDHGTSWQRMARLNGAGQASVTSVSGSNPTAVRYASGVTAVRRTVYYRPVYQRVIAYRPQTMIRTGYPVPAQAVWVRQP